MMSKWIRGFLCFMLFSLSLSASGSALAGGIAAPRFVACDYWNGSHNFQAYHAIKSCHAKANGYCDVTIDKCYKCKCGEYLERTYHYPNDHKTTSNCPY